jgi:hypothetical protein
VPAIFTYSAAGGTLEYNGSDARSTTDNEFPTSNGPANLIIDNTSDVTLHASRTIDGSLTFVTGDLITNGNTLTLGTAGIISGESSTGYLIGNLTTSRIVATDSSDLGGIGASISAGP